MWKWEVDEPRGIVVMVHGAGEHHARYEWLCRKWNEHGFDVIMGDLPGQGKTRGKRGHVQSFTQYIETLESWMDEAKKSDLPIVLFGHSMGGLIIIRTLMEKKSPLVWAVVLSSPCLGLTEPPPKPKEVASKLIHRVAPTVTSYSGIRTDLVTRNEEIREEYLKDELRVNKVSVRWYQELTKAMRMARRYPEKFPDIPLLIEQAGDDYLVDKYDVRAWFNHLEISDKYYKEWDGLYHEVFNEPERSDVFRHAIGFINMIIP